MIARITVEYGDLTEYPLAECVRGGWQNGVRFYPDEHVTEVQELYCFTAESLATHDAEVIEKTDLEKAIRTALRFDMEWSPDEARPLASALAPYVAARIRSGEGEG